MGKIERYVTGHEGGTESRLQAIGGLMLFLGIAGFILCLILAGLEPRTARYHNWGADGVSWEWIIVGTAILVQSLIVWVVFGASADIVRLVKKIAGMDYGGKIGSITDITASRCSNCKKSVAWTWNVRECPHCKEKFE